jgi:hypothetical protein
MAQMISFFSPNAAQKKICAQNIPWYIFRQIFPSWDDIREVFTLPKASIGGENLRAWKNVRQRSF